LTDPSTRYLSAPEAGQHLAELGEEFALIENPDHVFPPYELLPLRPKMTRLAHGVRAVLFDLDGTTTMTEDLCLHALETTVRRATGRLSRAGWAGLDAGRDYPHIIGRSTTSNVEYIVEAYGPQFQHDALVRAYLDAAAWNIAVAPTGQRRTEARANLAALGGEALLADPRFAALCEAVASGEEPPGETIETLARAFGDRLLLESAVAQVRAGLELYYQTLHRCLQRISQGKGAQVAREIFADGRQHPIGPLAGLGILLAVIKGWLGEDAGACAEPLLAEAPPGSFPPDEARDTLRRLGAYFAQSPVPVALVTSSGSYEAGVAPPEVFRALRDQAGQWPVSEAVRSRMAHGFAGPEQFYDAMITADDAHELRLKPYRDLYTIALHRLHIPPGDAHRVMGFEDTEAGVTAMRAAGIGLCCAVPFEGTAGHDFSAASHRLAGGFPEALLGQRLFLADMAPAAE